MPPSYEIHVPIASKFSMHAGYDPSGKERRLEMAEPAPIDRQEG
jgi:hypothetical protein